MNQKRYSRADLSYDMNECNFCYCRLTDGSGHNETVWGRQKFGRPEVILESSAQVLLPYPTVGVVVPHCKANYLELLNGETLPLHPEAWDFYLKAGIIDAKGNLLGVLPPTDEDE